VFVLSGHFWALPDDFILRLGEHSVRARQDRLPLPVLRVALSLAPHIAPLWSDTLLLSWFIAFQFPKIPSRCSKARAH